MPELPRDLREQLLANPDDVEAYLVCADWLQAHADPRGELIAIQHAQQSHPDDPVLRATQSELVRNNARHLLGDAADHLRCFCFDWQMGFIRALRMFGAARDLIGQPTKSTLDVDEQTPAETVLGALLQHPSTMFLRSLTLGPFAWKRETRGSPQALINALAEGPLPKPLRELFLFDDIDDMVRQRCQVGRLCEAIPQLQRLTLYGRRVVLGQPRLPDLRQLSVRGGPRSDANLHNVLHSELPSLQELTVWFELTESAIGVEHPLLSAALDGHFPELRALRLRNFRDTDALCTALADAPLGERLVLLELAMTELSASAIDALAAALGERLQRLELFGVRLDGAAAGRLQQRFPEAVVWWTPLDGVLAANPYVSYGGGVSFIGLRGRELSHADSERAAASRQILLRCAGAGRGLYDAGTRLVLNDKHAEGLPMLRAALEMPDSALYRSTFSNVGVTNERLGNLDAAEEIGRRAIAAFGTDPNHWAILIDALHRQGKLDEALEALAESERYIDGTANGMALLETCMMTLLVARRPEAARALYEAFTATGNTPRDESRGHAALTYAHCNQRDAAAALLRKLTRVNLPVVHHARACVRALARRRKPAAESVAKARSATYPGNALLDDDPILATILT